MDEAQLLEPGVPEITVDEFFGEDTQWIAKVFQVSELKYQLLVQASGCHGSSRKYLQ